ncbi:hypothetical protein [Estrella lausannensis]|uniref:Conserved putative secreted protein n=1 Tax=Estrella lausannensis TaxID=483423 RepID=A0A0H5E4B8_9BACT|nr:hypothetical protein [Estrella lausannensis]CRX38065.1 Conserved putative secreted protein [Estrella lausannensis]
MGPLKLTHINRGLKTFSSLSFLTFFLASQALHSEIQTIRVDWTPGFCLAPCEETLRQKLAASPNVAKSDVPPGASQATIRWKPDKKFSYQTLNFLIKGAGVKINQVFITAQGKIRHDSNDVYLVSQGDNTRFTLLSPIYVSMNPTQGQVGHNLDSYKLSASVREELINNQKEDKIVTVKGVLFDPWRYGELYLIMDSHSASAPVKKNERRTAGQR